MNINYLRSSRLLIVSALLSVLNVGLLPSIAQAQPTNKANIKISSLKSQDNQSLGLHLTLSRGISEPKDTTLFQQQNFLELSSQDSIFPLQDRSLIASSFSGQASWYGPGFHGRLTANGERYNQNALTAAHPRLRFGTRVRVTNLNNGRSVVVRINDRGPYAKGRIIDVSAAAAHTLGMIHSGVAPVKVTILGR